MNIGERLEAEPVLERAHAAAVETGDVPSQAYALMALSSVQESLGQDDKSLRNAQEAVELFKKTDSSDPAGLAEALYNQGWAYFRLGQAKKALSTAREGYKLSHNTNLQLTSGHFLNLMGVVNYYMLGKYNIANKNLETALTAYREAGYRKGESAVLNNIGENARLQGNFAAAARCYEEAVTIAHETENQNKEDIFLSNLCGARIRLGQFEKAAIDLEKLIAKIGHDWYGLSEAYRFLGEAYLGLGKTTQALDVTQQALALANPSNLFEHGRAWRVLGIIAAQLNEPIQSDVEDIQLYGTTDCAAAWISSGTANSSGIAPSRFGIGPDTN